MFERFTDRARRVVVLAQEEARLLNTNYIGTEHVLLGLIQEDGGVAGLVLRERLGLELDKVRETVVGELDQADAGAPTGHIPFTPRTKKVLEFSLREALQLGHNYIGTEHILLGLIREGEGIAAQVLVNLGADLSRVRQEIIACLAGYAKADEQRQAQEPTWDRSEEIRTVVLKARHWGWARRLRFCIDTLNDDVLVRAVLEDVITEMEDS